MFNAHWVKNLCLARSLSRGSGIAATACTVVGMRVRVLCLLEHNDRHEKQVDDQHGVLYHPRPQLRVDAIVVICQARRRQLRSTQYTMMESAGSQ